jgi:hypothetical protein
MPRAILSALVGAGLAVAGTATIATTISLRVSQPMFAGARAGHAAPPVGAPGGRHTLIWYQSGILMSWR